MRLWHVLLIAATGFGAWQYWQDRPHAVPEQRGAIAPNEPMQGEIKAAQSVIHGQYTLQPLASYDITARVLGKEIYRFDAGADLVPVDLALGWGAMSDSKVLDQLQITQSNRFYFYRWRGQPPIPVAQMVRQSANVHLIPADPVIEQKIRSVRPGQIVHLRGTLVEARKADGSTWRSSLTREDSGNGACELLHVESIEIRLP